MYNNKFQEYVVDILTTIIDRCKENEILRDVFLSYGSKHALKRGLITHYASMYTYKDEFRNLWQNSQIELCKPVLMSERVKEIINDVEVNYKGSYAKYKEAFKNKNDKEKYLIYWEHITPNEVVWQRVVDVFDDYDKDSSTEEELKEKIKNCFYGHRLVLITKAEAVSLDKDGGRTGANIDDICDLNNIKSGNIAEKRIKFLFDECGVKSLYLCGKRLEEKDLFDDEGNFIDDVKKYFTECDFSIENN